MSNYDRVIQNNLGFWEVAQKPSNQELSDHYKKKYWQELKKSSESKYNEYELRFLKAKIEQRYTLVEKALKPGPLPRSKTGKKQRSFLDVGCGEGFAMSFFKEHGFKVKGLDFSSHGITQLNPGCLEDLVTGDVFRLLDEEIAIRANWDVVWLQNVLEHVREPLNLLASLRQLLTSNGVLVVTVPNDFSTVQLFALSRGEIDEPFWISIPDHLSYFTHESLSKAITAAGFTIIDVLADFPIDWFLFHPASNYVQNKQQGRAAHLARVAIETLLSQSKVEDVNDFYSALARLGHGRNLTVVAQKSS
jgi:2-polyprenyl-3-methyl-5-hydroxy-6-metoxy-1,4-benzoquinol methylase